MLEVSSRILIMSFSLGGTRYSYISVQFAWIKWVLWKQKHVLFTMMFANHGIDIFGSKFFELICSSCEEPAENFRNYCRLIPKYVILHIINRNCGLSFINLFYKVTLTIEIHVGSWCEVQTTNVYDVISVNSLKVTLIFQMMIIKSMKIIFVQNVSQM